MLCQHGILDKVRVFSDADQLTHRIQYPKPGNIGKKRRGCIAMSQTYYFNTVGGDDNDSIMVTLYLWVCVIAFQIKKEKLSLCNYVDPCAVFRELLFVSLEEVEAENMWGFGGKVYWGMKERGKREGIVVVFAWVPSDDKHLKNYVDLYSSLGWNSLVCHSQFLNLFFPDKAASLALGIVNELVQVSAQTYSVSIALSEISLSMELKLRPCPVVFASFSGGSKACMYKVLQVNAIVVDNRGKYDEQINLDDYRLIRDCVCGHIFDSAPLDFASDLGTRFALHPAVLKMSRPPLVSWIATGISSSLDALFLGRFESQRADYWQTLYSTVGMAVPYLILCSEDDNLAPFQVISNFATRLRDLGADVKLVKWKNSSHVGHFRHHPEEYKAAVTDLLGKAAMRYSQRMRQLEGEKLGMEGTHGEISDPFCHLRKAAAISTQSFQRIALDLNDHFSCPAPQNITRIAMLDLFPTNGKNVTYHCPADQKSAPMGFSVSSYLMLVSQRTSKTGI
ncbi:UNVERIFIED_CONTAM: hypothetical protein Scaly_1120300 [Sesamum calycinum]|uniref:Uncharacterized protein n=1 Tax=Sesamum calycinum TaxID=2727403 RepID=A0AAW2QMI9_9LAMI